MKTRRMKKALFLLCLVLPMVLMTVAAAQSRTPSILNRVQRVDDPELGELIRVAMESRENLGEREQLDIIHRITLRYSQIKLLDQQVMQVSQKIESAAGPAEMRYELLLAKAELEAKLMQELADLREVMGVVPKYAFDRKPLESLNAWVHLHVLDQGVCVLDTRKPFGTYWAAWRFKSAGLLSQIEALDYVRERLKEENSLPIRIEIDHTSTMTGAANELREKVISLARETNSQMEAEVDLKLLEWVGTGESTFFLRDGTARTLHAAPVWRPDGGPEPLVTGVVEPNDLDQHIQWRLMMPGNVPIKFRIEYDEASAELASRIADRVRAIADRMNMAGLVEVAKARVEPIPEAVFQGRWQALGKGEIEAIDVYPDGVGMVTMGERSPLAEPGATVTCPWLLTTKEIVMDPKKVTGPGHRYVFQGRLDEDGNLVVYRGMIYPQGSFQISHAQPTILEKVR